MVINEIKSIKKEMVKLKNYDIELGHIDADELLLDLMGLLANECDDQVKDLVLEIIHEFNDLDKWYA
jgi:hypothetical protein